MLRREIKPSSVGGGNPPETEKNKTLLDGSRVASLPHPGKSP